MHGGDRDEGSHSKNRYTWPTDLYHNAEPRTEGMDLTSFHCIQDLVFHNKVYTDKISGSMMEA